MLWCPVQIHFLGYVIHRCWLGTVGDYLIYRLTVRRRRAVVNHQQRHYFLTALSIVQGSRSRLTLLLSGREGGGQEKAPGPEGIPFQHE